MCGTGAKAERSFPLRSASWSPNFLLTAYIAAAHQEYEQCGGSLPLDTMAVGDGSWLGDIRVVEEVVLDLDALPVGDEVHAKSGWEWAC